MMVHSNFDAKKLLSTCLKISPQIFAIMQNFAMDNLRDQQFCTLLCELKRLVVVLFTGNALEVEVPPGMVWDDHQNAGAQDVHQEAAELHVVQGGRGFNRTHRGRVLNTRPILRFG